jgi:hypothetical protein
MNLIVQYWLSMIMPLGSKVQFWQTENSGLLRKSLTGTDQKGFFETILIFI